MIYQIWISHVTKDLIPVIPPDFLSIHPRNLKTCGFYLLITNCLFLFPLL